MLIDIERINVIVMLYDVLFVFKNIVMIFLFIFICIFVKLSLEYFFL